MTLRKFFIGLLVAGISGAIDGVLLMLVDPENFNLQEWAKLATLTTVFGIKAAALYFKQHERELVDGVDVRKLTAVLLVVGLSLFGASCAKVTPQLLAGEKTVRSVVLAVSNTIEPMVCNAEARKVLTDRPCVQLLDALEPAVDFAMAYNRALAEGKAPAIVDTIRALDRLVAAVRNVVPDGAAKTEALADLAVARARAEGGR